jgi:hypothetical protein
LGEDFNGRIGERGAKRNKKLGGGTGGWEKKIQIQGGECGGKESDGMDRRKWMQGVEREQTGGRRRGMDIYR